MGVFYSITEETVSGKSKFNIKRRSKNPRAGTSFAAHHHYLHSHKLKGVQSNSDNTHTLDKQNNLWSFGCVAVPDKLRYHEPVSPNCPISNTPVLLTTSENTFMQRLDLTNQKIFIDGLNLHDWKHCFTDFKRPAVINNRNICIDPGRICPNRVIHLPTQS